MFTRWESCGFVDKNIIDNISLISWECIIKVPNEFRIRLLWLILRIKKNSRLSFNLFCHRTLWLGRYTSVCYPFTFTTHVRLIAYINQRFWSHHKVMNVFLYRSSFSEVLIVLLSRMCPLRSLIRAGVLHEDFYVLSFETGFKKVHFRAIFVRSQLGRTLISFYLGRFLLCRIIYRLRSLRTQKSKRVDEFTRTWTSIHVTLCIRKITNFL